MPLHPTGRSLSAILSLRDLGPSWSRGVTADTLHPRAWGLQAAPRYPCRALLDALVPENPSLFGRAGVHPCYSDARLRSYIRGDAGSTSILLTARLRSAIRVFLELCLKQPPAQAGCRAMRRRSFGCDHCRRHRGPSEDWSARRARNLTNVEEPGTVTSHYLKHEGGPGPLGRKPEVV